MTWYELVRQTYNAQYGSSAYFYPTSWDIQNALYARGHRIGPNELNEINRCFVLVQAEWAIARNAADISRAYERQSGNVPPC